jgi:rare lipoprotein A
MAGGEIYDEDRLTAAHRTLPFGTRVRVTNLANGKSVVVVVKDRGPTIRNRMIDVSGRAARELGFVREGVARVRMEVLPG